MKELSIFMLYMDVQKNLCCKLTHVDFPTCGVINELKVSELKGWLKQHGYTIVKNDVIFKILNEGGLV